MGPLKGLKVVDLSRVVAGNMTSLQLADFGAEVIKVKENYEDSLQDCIEQSNKNNWQIVQDVAWKDYMRVPKYTMAGYTVMMLSLIHI